jgi:hypothetical protein
LAPSSSVLEAFIERFKVPEVALPAINLIAAPFEQALAGILPNKFHLDEVEDAFKDIEDDGILSALHNETRNPEAFIAKAYRRAIFSIADDGVHIFSDFYSRLDVFASFERELYLSIPRETRTGLDGWYFNACCGRLSNASRPTQDEILPLEEILHRIDADPGSSFLRPATAERCLGIAGSLS